MRPTFSPFRSDTGEVLYTEPTPRTLDVAATNAKQVVRTKDLSDRVAFAYAHAADLVAGLRERAERMKDSSMAIKRDGIRLMYWGEAGTPIGLYADPLSEKIPEIKAGRSFVIEVLRAEWKGRKC